MADDEHRHDYRRCVHCEDVLGDTLSSEERVGVILEYARRHPSLRVFVETGTADGDTTAAVMNHFDQVYTIELDQRNYVAALDKFRSSPHVHPMHGDSGKIVPELAGYVGPAVWWLDSHWCGGARGETATPILEELDGILAAGRTNVILVDDARLFGIEPEWPELAEVITRLRDGGYEVSVTDDIVRAEHR